MGSSLEGCYGTVLWLSVWGCLEGVGSVAGSLVVNKASYTSSFRTRARIGCEDWEGGIQSMPIDLPPCVKMLQLKRSVPCLSDNTT